MNLSFIIIPIIVVVLCGIVALLWDVIDAIFSIPPIVWYIVVIIILLSFPWVLFF